MGRGLPLIEGGGAVWQGFSAKGWGPLWKMPGPKKRNLPPGPRPGLHGMPLIRGGN